jgi:Cu2+-exporting ATPase
MCCTGCKAVAEFIHDQDLGAYYIHRRPPAAGQPAATPDWSAYEHEDLVTRYVYRDGDGAAATIDIGGMYCSACAWLLETGLLKNSAVTNVALNPATRRAVVSWDASCLSFAGLLAAIAALGFKPAPAVVGAADTQHVDDRRLALRRLIVAAAAGMQVMMFAVALYAGDHFGIDGRIEQFLRLTSLLVCLPIVFYSARPFFEGALRGLRAGRPGMDLPVSLAIAAAFLASTVAALSNRGEIYFDSVAMFVLFLGGARYFELRARHRAEDQARAMAALLPETATRLTAGKPELIGVDRLRPGDRVLVRPGDIVPADGRILSGELSLDEALLTGESMPVLRGAGDPVFAGSINGAGSASIAVTQTGAGTSIAEIGRMIDTARADRPPIALLADRIAGRFVLAVLAVAALAGLVWLRVDAGRAFEVMLATLVVTCPCALSLATPAALAAAASRLGRDGILLVRARVLEVLARPAHIVFDKTGTLTQGQPRVTGILTFGDTAAARCLELATALESVSEHVLARAFTASGAGRVEPGELAMVPGAGIEGKVDGRRYRLGRRDFALDLSGAAKAGAEPADTATAVYLADEDGPLARFSIGDPLRADAADTVALLRRQGHRVSIASGDREETVAALAREVGIDEWQAALAPAAKLDYLERLRAAGGRVVMIGDGINDAPVLAAADASIAVDAGTALARASADVVVPGQRLLSIARIADTARATRHTIAQNLAWAVGYNLCAVPLAVSGLLAPWMAAIGMSLSSLLVVGNALRLKRTAEPLPRRTAVAGAAGPALEVPT